jgi:hypothetical protein
MRKGNRHWPSRASRASSPGRRCRGCNCGCACCASTNPTLHLRRDVDGQFYVAGIAVNQEGSDNGVADWVLAQKRIRINGATVVWEDARRDAPPLILEDVNLALDNDGRQHRFGLTALPPAELASKLDLRGDFHGKSIADAPPGRAGLRPDRLRRSGRLARLDRLPGGLAPWSRRGAGLGGFADGGLQELTADVSLDDVNLRLAKNLPALGTGPSVRTHWRALFAFGMRVDGRRVELVTRRLGRSTAVPGRASASSRPIFTWSGSRKTAGSKSVRGSATASAWNWGALAALPPTCRSTPGSRQLLNDYAPRGRVSELRASWQGSAEACRLFAEEPF